MSTTLRTRKNQKIYKRYQTKLDKSKCVFCELTARSPQVIKDLKHFWIINNVFGYDVWDSNGVKEQLILVPKRHMVSLAEFNTDEQQEFIKSVANYEKAGYSIYARPDQSSRKSVPHQHTHFIKTDNKVKRIVLFLKKPHLLLVK